MKLNGHIIIAVWLPVLLLLLLLLLLFLHLYTHTPPSFSNRSYSEHIFALHSNFTWYIIKNVEVNRGYDAYCLVFFVAFIIVSLFSLGLFPLFLEKQATRYAEVIGIQPVLVIAQQLYYVLKSGTVSDPVYIKLFQMYLFKSQSFVGTRQVLTTKCRFDRHHSMRLTM